jgi:hypothetical protein
VAAEDVHEQEPGAVDSSPASRWERVGPRLGQTAAVVIGLGLVVAALLAAREIWPDKIAPAADPSWLDSIFASKTVLFAARLVLFGLALVVVVGCVYTIASIVFRMQSGHWLRRIGPFEVTEQAVEELTGQINYWKNQAEESLGAIEQLQR